MIKFVFVLTAGLMISGCEQVKDMYYNILEHDIETQTIVISPGFEIDDDGQLVTVYGYEKCPETFLSSVKKTNCIIIRPKDTLVQVFIGYGKAPHKTGKPELWTIERQGEYPHNSMRLKRPDNSYVQSYPLLNSL